MIWIYLANTILALGIVFAVWFPDPTKHFLQRLGLWEWVLRVDRARFALWTERLGLFLVVASLALFASILTGSHPADWSLPAAEGLFFGFALFLAGYWSRPPHH